MMEKQRREKAEMREREERESRERERKKEKERERKRERERGRGPHARTPVRRGRDTGRERRASKQAELSGACGRRVARDGVTPRAPLRAPRRLPHIITSP